MRWILCFFILLSTSLVAQTQYQKHFPEDLYEYIIQMESINEELLENTVNKQFAEGETRISIRIANEGCKYLVLVDLWLENAVDHFHGMQVAYRNGRIFALAIFDEKGRDYVALAPFSEDEEERTKELIFDVIEGRFPG